MGKGGWITDGMSGMRALKDDYVRSPLRGAAKAGAAPQAIFHLMSVQRRRPLRRDVSQHQIKQYSHRGP